MKRSEFKIRKLLRKNNFPEDQIKEMAKSPFGRLYYETKTTDKIYSFKPVGVLILDTDGKIKRMEDLK